MNQKQPENEKNFIMSYYYPVWLSPCIRTADKNRRGFIL